MKKLLMLWAITTLLAGLAGTADADLLFGASMKNGDYGGGTALSPTSGISNSSNGTTFTSTEPDSQSNALINWQIPAAQRTDFRTHGTISFSIYFQPNYVGGWLFCDNDGVGGDYGYSTFAAAANRIGDEVQLFWQAWYSNVWDFPYDSSNRLQLGRWYNVGYTWGGSANDFEIWVDGQLVSARNWTSGQFPWGYSGINIGLGDNHLRGVTGYTYDSLANATFADIEIWNEYRQLGNTAVPIPPTVLLLGSGLVGLGAWRRFWKS